MASKNSILILAPKTDPEAGSVCGALGSKGGNEVVFWLATDCYPGSRMHLSIDDKGARFKGTRLGTVQAVYLRSLCCNPADPTFAEVLTIAPHATLARFAEKRGALTGLLRILQAQGTRLINTLEANMQHTAKPWQLHLLGTAGLPVPRWLASNHPRQVRDFAKTVGQVVYKPIAGGATANFLAPDDLTPKRLALLAHAPVLFQEYIEGEPLRVYVVGDQVVAAGIIHSRELDYRNGEEGVEPARLSPEETRVALAAAQACGMPFCGVDLIRGAKASVVLECNPSPMFASFAARTGLDIAGPLAEMLLARQ